MAKPQRSSKKAKKSVKKRSTGMSSSPQGAKARKSGKRPTTASKRKSPGPNRKGKTPTNRALHAHSKQVLMDVLVQVLTTPALRKKSGISLKGKQEVSISCDVDFLTAAQMRTVNQKYRKKKHATDVLSFPTPEVFRQQGMLGEILICTSILMKQARELGHTWKDELSALLVHGVLHLLDFDHERGPKDARLMQREEERLLSISGLISRSGN